MSVLRLLLPLILIVLSLSVSCDQLLEVTPAAQQQERQETEPANPPAPSADDATGAAGVAGVTDSASTPITTSVKPTSPPEEATVLVRLRKGTDVPVKPGHDSWGVSVDIAIDDPPDMCLMSESERVALSGKYGGRADLDLHSDWIVAVYFRENEESKRYLLRVTDVRFRCATHELQAEPVLLRAGGWIGKGLESGNGSILEVTIASLEEEVQFRQFSRRSGDETEYSTYKYEGEPGGTLDVKVSVTADITLGMGQPLNNLETANEVATHLIDLTNDARSERGLSALSRQSEDISEAHFAYMRNERSSYPRWHIGGVLTASRESGECAEGRIEVKVTNYLTEIITEISDAKRVADLLMESLMDSSEGRANVLDESAVSTGIDVFPWGLSWYVSQDFYTSSACEG